MYRSSLVVLSAAMLIAVVAAADEPAINSVPRTIDVIATDNRGAHLAVDGNDQPAQRGRHDEAHGKNLQFQHVLAGHGQRPPRRGEDQDGRLQLHDLDDRLPRLRAATGGANRRAEFDLLLCRSAGAGASPSSVDYGGCDVEYSEASRRPGA